MQCILYNLREIMYNYTLILITRKDQINRNSSINALKILIIIYI